MAPAVQPRGWFEEPSTNWAPARDAIRGGGTRRGDRAMGDYEPPPGHRRTSQLERPGSFRLCSASHARRAPAWLREQTASPSVMPRKTSQPSQFPADTCQPRALSISPVPTPDLISSRASPDPSHPSTSCFLKACRLSMDRCKRLKMTRVLAPEPALRNATPYLSELLHLQPDCEGEPVGR